MTIGINTSPLAGQIGQEAHRAAGQEPARRRAGRQRVDPRARRPSVRTPGRCRAAASCSSRSSSRSCAARASSSPSASRRSSPGSIDGKLHEPIERLTIDVPEDYLGVVTQLLGAAQGPPGADGQPRHRLGPDGVPRAGPRADRLPHRVPHRDPRHRPAAPRLRRLRAVARRAAHPPDRLAGRRPARARRPASRWPTCRSAARCSSGPAPRSTRA